MPEGQLRGVQPHAIRRQRIRPAAVKPVSHHGVADRGKVHPDLMGSTGLQFHRQKGQGWIVPVVDDPIASEGVLAARQHCSLTSAARIRAERGFDRTPGSLHHPVHQGEVAAFDLPPTQRGAQSVVGRLRKGGDQQAGRVPVQAMHNPPSGRLSHSFDLGGIGGADRQPGSPAVPAPPNRDG